MLVNFGRSVRELPIGRRKREACSFKYRRALFGNLKQRKKGAFVREEGKGEWIPPPLTFPLPSPG